MSEHPASPGTPNFDTPTHQYFREVIWPAERQHRAEQAAATRQLELQQAEKAKAERQARIEGYQVRPRDELAIVIVGLGERVRKLQQQVDEAVAMQTEMIEAYEALENTEQ